MKKTDIAMIIFIASLSILVAYALMSQIPLFKDVNKPVVIKTATPINPDLSDEQVDSTIFNTTSLNPTVKITIGESQPASGS